MRSLARAIAAVAVMFALAGPVNAQRFENEHKLLQVDELPLDQDGIRQVVQHLSLRVKYTLQRVDSFVVKARENMRQENSPHFSVNLKNDRQDANQLESDINQLINMMPYLSADGADISADKKKIDATTRLLFAARSAIDDVRWDIDSRESRLRTKL